MSFIIKPIIVASKITKKLAEKECKMLHRKLNVSCRVKYDAYSKRYGVYIKATKGKPFVKRGKR